MIHRRLLIAIPLLCTGAFSQSDRELKFEVAILKRVNSSATGRAVKEGGPGTPDPTVLRYENLPLIGIICIAYDCSPEATPSGPSWLASETYSITARVPPGATKDQFNTMLRNLLAERLGLVAHHETRQIPGYDLTLAKNGSKLKEWIESPSSPALPPLTPEDLANRVPDHDGFLTMNGHSGMKVIFDTSTGQPFYTFNQQPLSALISQLTRWLHPLADKTGLKGKYDFKFTFAPIRQGAAPAATDATDPAGTDISTALQQLGLKLENTKVPVDVVVVDKIEKEPTEN